MRKDVKLPRQRRSARQAFKSAMGREPGRVNPFAQETAKPQELDRAALFHYWHPDRQGVERAPAHFAKELTKIAGTNTDGEPNAVCVRPPAGAPVRSRCWLVFKRNKEITHALSPGWFLVLAWHNDDYPHPKPLPLDNRLFANLYLQSVKAGREVMGRDFDSSVQYFDHCMSVLDRDEKKRKVANRQYSDDRSKDYYDYMKIKNIGHGSKFALHHDGTVIPSRGEQNWSRSRSGQDLPSDVVARDREETRQRTATVRVGSPSPMQREGQRQMKEMMEQINRARTRVKVGLDLPNRSPLER